MQTLLIEMKHAVRGIAAQPSLCALVVGVLGVDPLVALRQ